ncbi:MAG: UbiA family prenyltransferase, partial [Methanobacteriota archaeon]
TSVMIAVSGGFRVYVAFLLLGVKPEVTICLAMILITYATYTLDRAVKTKEDEINRRGEESAKRSLALLVVGASLLVAILILIKQGISPLIAFFPFMIGFAYSKGIKIGKISLKLKRSLGIKNIVVAFTWASTICALIYSWAGSYLQLLLIFAFFFLKSFINTVICDCRDVKGDSLAGLTTLPVYFGEARTKMILQLLHSSFHLSVIALILLKLIEFETIILLYSWMAGMIYIPLYANSKKTIFRSAVVHGEWVHMLMFRSIAIQLSRSASHSS